MSLIQAIALLCMANGQNGWMTNSALNLKCQKQLIECVEPVQGLQWSAVETRLMECVKKRKAAE